MTGRAASDGLRLAVRPGERIARDRPVSFSFEGRNYVGCEGDTIASALAANGVWVLSRSFKYRRPRGVLSMTGQDANTLVQLPQEPNVRADMRPISPGLVVTGQNYSGSLERDHGAYIEALARFLPVGFYYKAFFRPKGAWRFWERVIRARAGLGVIDPSTPHGYFDKVYGFYDVVVIGGGPAGLAASVAAARAGAGVLLVEEQPELGGSLTYARFDAEDEVAAVQREALIAAVLAEPNIEVMTGAVCQAWFVDNWLPVIRGNRLHKVRARRIVLAAGSMEQPMVFRNNDLPGVMLASAAQRLVRHYGVRPGTRAVVATANGDGYAAALDLTEAGVEVAAVLDLRESPPACARSGAVRDRGLRIVTGHTVWQALPARGKRQIVGVEARRIAGTGLCAASGETIDCDLLITATGYAPTAQLLCHAGGRVGYDPARATFAIRERPDAMLVAGAVNGAHDLDAVIADGRHAGWTAARTIGLDAGVEPPAADRSQADQQNHPWPIFPHPRGKDFVDFDEDLQVRDIRDAIAEGFDHGELLKRYSTAGMGPSQGRLSALATARLAAEATGPDMTDVGTTTARPPFVAETIGVLAGRGFEPVRRSPMHHRHLEAGAQMMVAGAWMRPAHYGAETERATSIEAEAVSVRTNVGLIDVSTLGGLEVRGPDAAEFLNRVYTFAYLKQPVGRARYVLMCDETGTIIDDGVACRLTEEHFYVTATTGAVDRVHRQMLWFNAQWRLEVDIANVTAAWCGLNIAGPRSREVLAPLCLGVDLAPETFPYMGVRTGTVAGIPVRLLRVGFVGELGYEIHAPASQGEALWDALIEAGADHSIRPFGVEAQRLLRLEKGHIIVGQDTDGLTFPHEADMAWAVSRKKPFFVGGRAIDIRSARAQTRKLVGFTLADPSLPPPAESHLVIRGGEIAGRVTSSAWSPTLQRPIGLAYVHPDQAHPGLRFDIKTDADRLVEAKVAPLPFYDPDNARQET